MDSTTAATLVDSSVRHLEELAMRLVGEWHDVQADGKTVFHEQWQRTDDAFYAGLGFVMSGSDTVFIEHLNISWDSAGARYSARIPSQNNGAYVDFGLTFASSDSVVFADPAHDFPQRIRYAPVPDGWDVLVSGLENGVPRSEDFHLTRRPQGPATTAISQR